jgi:excisionase family DNA binding protein
MTTFTIDISPERARDAEVALRALLPFMNKRSKFIHMQLSGSAQSTAIPREAFTIVIDVLRHVAHGEPVAVVGLDTELSTQQAADILKVSRPYLIGLLDAGAIPSRKVGKHRRVKMADLITYQQAEEQTRKERLDELTAEAQRLGLGY